ncbi:uncharacterized protein LOC142570922 [Dermacentor variabilis]|uniref:uncharacterized protein LOC142570922 n=1 Tax=Dermacentor variabilis TaxID=34621 RepID=UPI003F5B3EF1
MNVFCWLLVIGAASTTVAVAPLPASLDEQVDAVLQKGELCKVIDNDECEGSLQNFGMWKDDEWFWPDFYDGRVVGVRQGIRRTGDCALNASVATCELCFANLAVRYRWLVVRKDPERQREEQFHGTRPIVEAGDLTATLAEGTGLLLLRKDIVGGHFRATAFETDIIEFDRLVFDNSTIHWHDDTVDTNDEDFQGHLRNLLAERLNEYVSGMAFLAAFNEALENVQKTGNFRK